MVEFHEIYRKLKVAFEVIRGAWGAWPPGDDHAIQILRHLHFSLLSDYRIL